MTPGAGGRSWRKDGDLPALKWHLQSRMKEDLIWL